MARVLVVDDDPTVREVVVSYLRAAQHEVLEAADGESVATIMRDTPADLISLPTRRLRQMARRRHGGCRSSLSLCDGRATSAVTATCPMP